MSAQHMPAAPAPAPAPVPIGAESSTGRFVSLSLSPSGLAGDLRDAGGDVVLARTDGDLRPDAMVLARGDGSRLEVRRVGRLDADSVELLPVDAASPPLTVPRRSAQVVGTVVLRWREG